MFLKQDRTSRFDRLNPDYSEDRLILETSLFSENRSYLVVVQPATLIDRSRFNWTGPVKFLSYGWLCAWEHMQKLFQHMLLFIVTHSKPFYTLKCCLKLFSRRRGIARKVLTAFLTKDSSNPILLLQQMCDFGTFFPIGILYYNIS